MPLITESYLNLNKELHENNKNFGISGQRWAKNIFELSLQLKTKDVLDYGCGKNTLANNLPFDIKQYDPAILKYSNTPDPADLVVCTDVLEHIEPECLDDVLDDINRLVKVCGFFVIANGEAFKKLPDGRNAHFIQEDEVWWLPKICSRFKLVSFNNMIKPGNNEHKLMLEYVLVVNPKG